mgnify:CR=1 FL=1
MHQPEFVLESGTPVHTHKTLESEQGMIAMPSLLANRRPDADGTIHGIVPGHGADVYWVKHQDAKIAPYAFSEFDTKVESVQNAAV